MANFDLFISQLIDREGGFVNNPADRGGATKFGITIKTLSYVKGKPVTIQDVRNLTLLEAKNIYKNYYWNPILADKIISQEIAEMLADWKVNGGLMVQKIQQVLNVKADGKIGIKTIEAINRQDPLPFFEKLKKLRKQYYENIVRNDPSQSVFLDGWKDRLEKMKVPVQALSLAFLFFTGVGIFLLMNRK